MINFGPAGSSLSFYEEGMKSSVQMPGWLEKKGLNAYEYQCNKGVKIKEETAARLGAKAVEHGIALSIHAPYYINMSSVEEVKRENSKEYMLQSMRAAKWMGATKIVVHPGACTGLDRGVCTQWAVEVLKKTLAEAKEEGLDDIIICPELMGKENQLGNLDEVIEMSRIDDRISPCIDFGHLNARTLGWLKGREEYAEVLDRLKDGIGSDKLKYLHCHFSRIEFTAKGEKRHWTYADTQFGPDFEPLAEEFVKRGMEPTVICESDGTQAEDSVIFRSIYEEIRDRSL